MRRSWRVVHSPVKLTPEGYLETIPQLVVEIRSKNDSARDMADRVADYLKAGVVVVWVVEPATETVTEHRNGEAVKSCQRDETLRCEDVIPSFKLTLAELFQQ